MKTRRLHAFLCVIAVGISFLSAAPPEKATSVSVSGLVQDEKGQAAVEAIVETSLGGKHYSTKTDASGRFTFQVPAPNNDKLYLAIRARTADSKLQGFTTIGPEINKPLVLKPAREFPISVNDADGKPVAGALIMANADYISAGDTLSDEAGKATLRIPADATPMFILAVKNGIGLDYRLFWRKDQPKTDPYRLDSSFTGPLTFALNGMVKLSVQVKDESQNPVAGVRIYPWLFEKPAHGDDANLGGLSYFQRISDENGTAEIEIPADQQRAVNVCAYADGYSSRKRWLYDIKKDQ